MSTPPVEAPRRGTGGLRDRVRDRRQRSHADHDAFMSYSREDRALAEQLQHRLERFAKPWNRVRSLRVYRDVSSLSPEAGLWKGLERGLETSEWFVLLASPAAARSRWVDREIAWWREHRAVERIIIVLAEGTLVWDEDEDADDFDFERSDAAPPALRGAFAAEPALVVASALREAGDDTPLIDHVIGSLVSAIKQIPKDEAFADAVREHRKTRRLARAGVASLAVLLAVAVVAGILAMSQRDTARTQARLAVSRQIAAVSESLRATNLDASLVLAVESVRRDSNPQTRSALLSAALASPRLVRYYDLGSPVKTVAGSANGRVIVAGLDDGRIMRWDRTAAPKLLAKLPRAIAQIGVDATGTTVVATDGAPLSRNATAVILHLGRKAVPLRVPEGQSANAVSVSPSGRTVLVAGEAAASGGRADILIIDGRTGDVEARHDATDVGITVRPLLPSDEQAILFDAGYGGWDRRDIETWTTVNRGGVAFGTHQAAGEPSADGRYMTATNGSAETPIWPMRGKPENDRPALTATAPISNPDDLALSPRGTRLAVADTGVTYVVQTVRPGEPQPSPVVLEGNGNVDKVRFFGGDSRLLTVSRTKVGLWDLKQPDRLARAMKVPVGMGCSACGGAWIAVSPNGTRAAVVSGMGNSAAIVDLRTGRSQSLASTDFDRQYTAPFWDGRTAVFPVVPPGGGSQAEAAGGLPTGAVSWRAGEGATSVVTASLVAPGRAVAVDQRGKLFVHRTTDGTIERTITPFPDLQIGDVSIQDATIDSASGKVAILLDARVSVVDVATGKIVIRFRDPGATHVAFAGRRLFVQKDDGTLEVRSGSHARLERTLVGDPSYVWPPVPNPQGTIVARQRQNGQIVLVDADTGSTLGIVPANAGAKTGVAFAPDGSHLVTVTDETTYQAGALLLDRDISPAALIRSACLAAGSPLSKAQWARFVGSGTPVSGICR